VFQVHNCHQALFHQARKVQSDFSANELCAHLAYNLTISAVQLLVAASQCFPSPHSHKQLQSSKQIFQSILNFPFILKLPQETFTLFKIEATSFHLARGRISHHDKLIFIALDK
jgi:hypothetical protein